MSEESTTKSFEHFIGKQRTLQITFQLTKKEGALLDTLIVQAKLVDKNDTERVGEMYSSSMKVFSHKDGLDSLTHIVAANEINEGFQIQFDYGGMILEAIIRKQSLQTYSASLENKQSLDDGRITNVEQKIVELYSSLKTVDALKEENQRLQRKVTTLEERMEKMKTTLKGSEGADVESVQLAFSRFFAEGSIIEPPTTRIVTVSPKKLELSTVLATESGFVSAVSLIKRDDTNNLCVKLIVEGGVYVVWFVLVQYSDFMGVCTRLKFKMENDTTLIGVPLIGGLKWFEMRKESDSMDDVMGCVVRSYQLLGALMSVDIPVVDYLTTEIVECKEKMGNNTIYTAAEGKDMSMAKEMVVEVVHEVMDNSKEELFKLIDERVEPSVSQLKEYIQEEIKNSKGGEYVKLDSEMPRLDEAPKQRKVTRPQDIPVQQQIVPRSRGRREAFYHAQQPIFDADGQCIAVGSSVQLPPCSFTGKITQNGVFKIGESILSEDAIMPLNEVEVGIAQTIGRKNTMEDTCAVFETNIPFMEIIGLFDGHHGADAAKILSERMGPVIKKCLKENKKDVKGALTAAFAILHETVVNDTESGSTASIVAIEHNKMYVASVGDSPVFVVRRDAEPHIEKITNDHRPDNEAERAAVEERGGHCYRVGNIWRVEGILMLSRTLGDRALHPAVGSEPEVTEWSLDNVSEVVLASDGVTDVVGNEAIYDAVVHSSHVDSAATTIRDSAYKGGSADNITCIVVKIQHQ